MFNVHIVSCDWFFKIINRKLAQYLKIKVWFVNS